MSDIEALLRSTLTEHADGVEPRPDAMRHAVSAVQGRHRTRTATQALAAAAAVGAIVVTATLWHPFGPAAEPATQAAVLSTTTPTTPAAATATTSTPTTTSPSPRTPAVTSKSSNAQSGRAALQSAFGVDYTPQPQSPSGFGGDLTLTPGSPSAAGLPPGYGAAVTYSLLDATSDSANGPVDTITALCGGFVEKGATFKACVPQQVGGLTVQRSEIDAPNTKVGTWATLRLLFKRPDKLVQYTEITIWKTSHDTTAQERATAASWLNSQATKLATSATAAP
jgi:hypothetical protein